MAGVRKTSGPSAARAVVYDFRQAKASVSMVDHADRADSLGIIEQARALASAPPVGEESEEVRAERVRALKEAIANGTYIPDPHEIARKMVERGFK